MADLLYLFGYSLNISNQFEQVVSLVKNQLTKGMIVDIVLLHDAVVGTSRKGVTPKSLRELLDFAFQMKNVRSVKDIDPTVKLHVFVMQQDYDARGFRSDAILPNLTLLSYNQLVERMDIAKKLISWM